MEIDAAKLGPYASLYKEILQDKEKTQKSFLLLDKSGSTKPKPADRKANFAAYYKKTNSKFLQDQDGRRQARTLTMEERRKLRRSQMVIAGRKPAICEMTNELNALIYDDSSNEISELEGSSVLQTSLKDKIGSANSTSVSEVLENPSKIEKKTANGNLAVSGKSLEFSKMQKSAGVSKNQNKNPTPPQPAKTITDSRRDQLQKWKKEKQVADSQIKVGQRQPFKVGATKIAGSTTSLKSATSTASTSASSVKSASVSISGTSKPAVGQGKTATASSGRLASRTAVSSKISAPPSKPTAPAAVPKKPEEIRRVTRAMTKTTNPVAVQPVSARAPATKLATDKMKALNLNDKPTTRPLQGRNVPTAAPVRKVAEPAKAKPITSGQRPKTQNTGQSEPEITTVTAPVQPKPESSTASASVQPDTLPEPQVESIEERQVKKKKAKPQALDATYRDYNFRFADASRRLGDFQSEWRDILENGKDIPEDVRDDIFSSLGKIKLLLDSKLPQFAELLNLYICKAEDTTQILACDLEGWWDVAYIQVEAVYKVFEKLAILKSNNWTQPDPQPVIKPVRKNENGEVPKKPVAKPAVKAKATGGLKAFLAAKKRQLMSNNSDDSSPVDAQSAVAGKPENSEVFAVPAPSVPLPLTPKRADPEDERNFEGGFFSISSPASAKRRPAARSLLVTPSTTPNPVVKRLSRLSVNCEASRRQSLTMLGVRRSMGALSKIGVSALATDITQNEINI